MRRHQIPGSTIHGPNFGKSYASGHSTTDVTLYATVTNRILHGTWALLVGPAGALIASKAKHSESFGSALLGPRHADVLPCHRWYLGWSGDMETLDGETFLDMQLAPHQAEASTLAKHSIICYKEREAMSNSVDT